MWSEGDGVVLLTVDKELDARGTNDQIEGIRWEDGFSLPSSSSTTMWLDLDEEIT
jgi:hypothetical protein